MRYNLINKNKMRDKIIKILREIEMAQLYSKEIVESPDFSGPDSNWEDVVEYEKLIDRNALLHYDRQISIDKNIYIEYDNIEIDKGWYEVRSFLSFPNYEYLTFRLTEDNNPENDTIFNTSLENKIRTEIYRMKLDNLVTIGEQSVKDCIIKNSTNSKPQITLDPIRTTNTESITLTTKGLNKWGYFKQKAAENPITTITSIVALIISLISLFK